MKHLKLFLGMLALGLLIFLPGKNVQAYAKITQTAQTQNSISISWTDPNAGSSGYKTTGYELRYQKSSDSSNIQIDTLTPINLSASATSYTLSGLQPGTRYTVRLTYKYTYTSSYDGTVKYYDSTVSGGYGLFTLPGKVTGVNQTRWYHYIHSVNFDWDKQDACDYEWVVKNEKGSVLKKGTGTYASAGSVSNTMTYNVQVRAILKDSNSGNTYYGDWSDKAYLFGQPMIKIKSTKVSGSKLTLKFDKVSGMSQYKVYISTKQNSGYKKAATLKKSKKSATIKKYGKKKIKKNKTYYVYVVGIKKVGGRTYTSGVNYVWKVKKNKCTELYIQK